MSKELVMDNVAIPYVEYNDRWIAPDLERSWQYYPNYLRHAKSPVAPAQYLCNLVAPLPPDKRDQALKDFTLWSDTFMQELPVWNEIWQSYTNPVTPKGEESQ